MANVTIYSGSNCKYCTIAKEYFKQNGIEYTELNVQEDDNAMEFLIERNIRTVPYIVIGDVELIGFDVDKVEEALNVTNY